MNLVRSILREKEGSTVNEWEDWSSIFISRKDSTSSKNEQEKAYCLGRIDEQELTIFKTKKSPHDRLLNPSKPEGVERSL